VQPRHSIRVAGGGLTKIHSTSLAAAPPRLSQYDTVSFGVTTTAGLLACGVASSVLYVAMDVMLSLRFGDYSYADQAVSELNATGAPTRSAFLACSAAYNVLLTACGAGVWRSGRQRAAHITGAFLIASAAVGMATPLFFPMDQRGADERLHGSLHGPMTGPGSFSRRLWACGGVSMHRLDG
jgi:hypothetical protein